MRWIKNWMTPFLMGTTAGIKFTHRRKSGLHRFTSNLAGLTGKWVRLAVRNFTSITTRGGNAAPNIKKKHFLVKSLPVGGDSLDRF